MDPKSIEIGNNLVLGRIGNLILVKVFLIFVQESQYFLFHISWQNEFQILSFSFSNLSRRTWLDYSPFNFDWCCVPVRQKCSLVIKFNSHQVFEILPKLSMPCKFLKFGKSPVGRLIKRPEFGVSFTGKRSINQEEGSPGAMHRNCDMLARILGQKVAYVYIWKISLHFLLNVVYVISQLDRK